MALPSPRCPLAVKKRAWYGELQEIKATWLEAEQRRREQWAHALQAEVHRLIHELRIEVAHTVDIKSESEKQAWASAAAEHEQALEGLLQQGDTARPQQSSSAPSVVYVLELEHGKYYVGRCAKHRFDKRMQEHTNLGDGNENKGSEWTRRYRVTRVLEQCDCWDNLDENLRVLQLMREKGVDNVRGGPWPMSDLGPHIHSIHRQLSSASDSCFHCMSAAHFAVDCPHKGPAARQPTSPCPSPPPAPAHGDAGSRSTEPCLSPGSSTRSPSRRQQTNARQGEAARPDPALWVGQLPWPTHVAGQPPLFAPREQAQTPASQPGRRHQCSTPVLLTYTPQGRWPPSPSPAARALEAPDTPTRKRPKGQQASTSTLQPRSLAPQFSGSSDRDLHACAPPTPSLRPGHPPSPAHAGQQPQQQQQQQQQQASSTCVRRPAQDACAGQQQLPGSRRHAQQQPSGRPHHIADSAPRVMAPVLGPTAHKPHRGDAHAALARHPILPADLTLQFPAQYPAGHLRPCNPPAMPPAQARADSAHPQAAWELSHRAALPRGCGPPFLSPSSLQLPTPTHSPIPSATLPTMLSHNAPHYAIPSALSQANTAAPPAHPQAAWVHSQLIPTHSTIPSALGQANTAAPPPPPTHTPPTPCTAASVAPAQAAAPPTDHLVSSKKQVPCSSAAVPIPCLPLPLLSLPCRPSGSPSSQEQAEMQAIEQLDAMCGGG